jgi:pimeloyl-ACP methyl ester carboxylesterase
LNTTTIIIWGDSDRLIPPVYAHGFKKGIAHAQLVSIPEAGHMVILEKPDAVADAVSRLG